jgi:dihydroneopterin aldolase
MGPLVPSASHPVIVKVGGSLYDLPDLGPRLRAWLDRLDTLHALIVPGGGPLADSVRQFDQQHALGEEKAHWLALRALALNAHCLAAIVPRTVVIGRLDERLAAADAGRVPVLDPYEFARQDEGRAGHLPHLWAVTSDSVAARVAVVENASQLILLKSITVPAGMSWMEAGRRGYVDPHFADVAKSVPPILVISSINFRENHREGR